MSANDPTLASFLRTFDEVERKALSTYVNEEKRVFSDLFSNFEVAERNDAQNRRVFTPEFNLFKILNIGHLEERVHSPFLSNLLRPTGTHDQGMLFFTAFIDHLFYEGYSQLVANVSIKEEFSTNYGVFDIFIQYQINSKPFYLVIENKIYAADQDQQMTRYHKALVKSFSARDNFLLVYLTPYGQPPQPYSISDELRTALTTTKNFRCLSYHQDITNILNRCMLKIEAPLLKATVSQYLSTIQYL